MRIELPLDRELLGDACFRVALGAQLEALTLTNLAILQAHDLPPLYRAGVRYRREPGREVWQHALLCYAARHGDCEDLATWRAAELRRHGHAGARAVFRWRPTPVGGRLYHILTEWPDGRLEDPSRILGM